MVMMTQGWALAIIHRETLVLSVQLPDCSNRDPETMAPREWHAGVQKSLKSPDVKGQPEEELAQQEVISHWSNSLSHG